MDLKPKGTWSILQKRSFGGWSLGFEAKSHQSSGWRKKQGLDDEGSWALEVKAGPGEKNTRLKGFTGGNGRGLALRKGLGGCV